MLSPLPPTPSQPSWLTKAFNDIITNWFPSHLNRSKAGQSIIVLFNFGEPGNDKVTSCSNLHVSFFFFFFLAELGFSCSVQVFDAVCGFSLVVGSGGYSLLLFV